MRLELLAHVGGKFVKKNYAVLAVSLFFFLGCQEGPPASSGEPPSPPPLVHAEELSPSIPKAAEPPTNVRSGPEGSLNFSAKRREVTEEESTSPVTTSEPLIPAQGVSEPRTAGTLKMILSIQGDVVRLVEARFVQDNPSIFLEDVGTAPYVVKVVSSTGAVLFSGGFSDPLLVRYERENPEKPGVWEHQDITLDQTDFWLKVPATPEGREVLLYRKTSGEGFREIGRFPLSQLIP